MNIQTEIEILMASFTNLTLIDGNFSNLHLENLRQIIYTIEYEYPWDSVIQYISMRTVCKKWLSILSNINAILKHLKILPLHFAAMKNDVNEIIRLKINHINSLLEPDHRKYRAAHYAIATNSHFAMKILKVGGALDTIRQDNKKLEAYVVNNNPRSLEILSAKYDKEYTIEELFNFIKKGDIIELTDILSKIENPNILVQLSIQASSNIPKELNRKSYMQLIYFALTSRLENELFDSITHLTNLPSHFFQMFKLEANPNAYDEFGRTALGRACIDPNLFPTVVELLKCENIDINLLSKDKEIYAPIHIAVYHNNIQAVQTLLEIKDSNGKYRVNINIKNGCGSTPIFIVSEKGDSRDLLELLLQHGADVNIQEHEYGYAPIHIAAQNGNVKILETLLGDSTCNFELFDFNGNTALSIATIFDREDCVEFLLQKRANKFCVDKYGDTLLYTAALEGSIKSMNKLFPSLNKIVDIPNNIGLTPLHIATIRGNTLCTKLLIENGAKVNSRNKNGQTPLHCAATNNNIQDIMLLLTNGAIINARTNDGFIYKNTNVGGYTALHYAVYKGHLKVIQELIKYGADVYAKTTLGKNVFDIAQDFGHQEVVEYLIEKNIF